jgi:hypothetical protein
LEFKEKLEIQGTNDKKLEKLIKLSKLGEKWRFSFFNLKDGFFLQQFENILQIPKTEKLKKKHFVHNVSFSNP